MLKSYKCEGCSAPATAKRRNAKYCTVCRLVKNVMFIKDNSKKCWLCESKFAPLERNDVFCGTCDEDAPRGNTGTCSLCQAEAQLYRDDISVCVPCMKDPEQRPLLLRALRKKQRARRKEHGHAEAHA